MRNINPRKPSWVIFVLRTTAIRLNVTKLRLEHKLLYTMVLKESFDGKESVFYNEFKAFRHSSRQRLFLMHIESYTSNKNVDYAVVIFNEYGDFIRRIVHFHVKDEMLANDIFQDFFLKLASAPLPSNINNMKSYLFRTITNDVIDAKRRIKTYRDHMRNYVYQCRSSTIQSRPEDAIMESENINVLLNAMEKQLLSSEAKAINLRYREECDIGEIAEKMGIKERSVSRYISVGLKKIREAFAS